MENYATPIDTLIKIAIRYIHQEVLGKPDYVARQPAAAERLVQQPQTFDDEHYSCEALHCRRYLASLLPYVAWEDLDPDSCPSVGTGAWHSLIVTAPAGRMTPNSDCCLAQVAARGQMTSPRLWTWRVA